MSVICDAAKDQIALTNLVKLADHAEVDVTCRKCGWHERVNLSLNGNVETGTLDKVAWIHAKPRTVAKQ